MSCLVNEHILNDSQDLCDALIRYAGATPDDEFHQDLTYRGENSCLMVMISK